MIYLPTSEIFSILKALIKQSDKMKMKDPEQRKRLRWHIPTNAEDHTQLISTFIAGYMNIKQEKKKGQKTILEKCYEIQLNFDQLIHNMLNSMLTCVLPLDLAIHVTWMFIMEGQKALFRSVYAVLKYSRDVIAAVNTKKDIITKIREHCKSLSVNEFLKLAYETKMKTTGYYGK